MRHNYLKPALALTLLLGSYMSAAAQIVLHDATNVTQTKATLSADFPDTSVEHGFQYKYGTLPVIDDFSRCALAPNSDPVQITTSGNKWKNRDVKGWVESFGNLGNGQSSTMSASTTIYEPTTLTFEWSVDSEENYGILSFTVDNVEIAQISGEVPFTTVSTELTSGEHKFAWTYTKKSATNVGLDLGMVRNINFQNTTPGEWVTKTAVSDSYGLTNLYPGQSHLFRAFAHGSYSTISSFTTDEISCGNVTVNPITQTTATLSALINSGDAEVEKGFIVYATENPYFSALVSDDFSGDVQNLDFSCNGTSPWVAENNALTAPYYVNSVRAASYTITLSFTIEQDMFFSFDYGIRGKIMLSGKNKYASLSLKCSGSTYINTTIASAASDTSYKTGTYSHTFPAGSYELTLTVSGYAVGAALSDLSLTPVGSQAAARAPRKTKPYSNPQTIVITGADDISTKLEGLTSDKAYWVSTFMKRTYTGDLESTWDASYSPLMRFRTLPVVANTPAATDIKQASAMISGTVDAGDATTIAAGLQYKDKTGSRWTDYPKEITDNGFSQKITRLKPNTGYDFRSYIQAENCDTVFSETMTFTTLAVNAEKPTLKSATQHTATLEGKVVFGDANIYQRGMQFRKTGDTNWEEVEDGGNDSIFTLVKKNLEMTRPYQARTYVQPAGCDIIYSDILNFWTKHYVNPTLGSYDSTQSTATVKFFLEDCDDIIEEAGIEYGSTYFGNDWIKASGQIEGNNVIVALSQLTFNTDYYYRPYVKVGGEYFYYYDWEGSANFKTKDATISAKFSSISQTKATMAVTKDFGDVEVTELQYRLDYGEYRDLTDKVTFTGLTPGTKHTVTFRGKVNGVETTWTTQPGSTNPYTFTTGSVSLSAYDADVEQTSAVLRASYSVGDATFIACGFEYGPTQSFGLTASPKDKEIRITELIPATTYYYRAFVETKEGGKVYSATKSFTTSSIICTTESATNISNRSAKLNGNIDCDSYSSAEFGFQWKQMEGWQADPRFTKGVKQDDGTISVALVNGMLEPYTDHQYRAAVRYQGKIYAGSEWRTFRTENEFVYYPASVYTVFRTDSENNCLVMCGYYIAGSESIVSQGYEYWTVGQHSSMMKVPQQTVKVETDDSMQHTFNPGELANGNYAIRAYVKTESGEMLYGATLGFTVSADGYSEVEGIITDEARIYADGTTLKVVNAGSLDCYIYNLSGMLIAERLNMTDHEEFSLRADTVYLVTLSNGKVMKIRI